MAFVVLHFDQGVVAVSLLMLEPTFLGFLLKDG
jgi:hypothetical protein